MSNVNERILGIIDFMRTCIAWLNPIYGLMS